MKGYKTYTFTCTVPTEKLGLVVDLLKDEVISLKFEPNGDFQEQEVPVSELGKVALTWMEGNKGSQISIDQIRNVLKEAGYHANSASAIMSKLVSVGRVQRIGRGHFKVPA